MQNLSGLKFRYRGAADAVRANALQSNPAVALNRLT
jgi:hypothetical protein